MEGHDKNQIVCRACKKRVVAGHERNSITWGIKQTEKQDRDSYDMFMVDASSRSDSATGVPRRDLPPSSRNWGGHTMSGRAFCGDPVSR